MTTTRSYHHRRQAEDYNNVSIISCDYEFFSDSKDDEQQLVDAESIAVDATSILVVRDKRSKMIHIDVVRCKGIEDELPIETIIKWILTLFCGEVIIRTDGESSIVALSGKITENLKEVEVKAIQNTSPSHDSRLVVQAEVGVRILTEENSNVD